MEKNSSVTHICMISDDGYVMPTCVALQSLVSTKKEGIYHIHIIASSLSEAAENQFKQFAGVDVIVDIIRENAEERFKGFHIFEEGAICVASISALLKFLIPEMFPEIDKILYLDGDLIVKKDINEIYNEDLEGYYAAAVVDSGSIYYKHEYVKRVANYFNSGVMLLNLKKLREEKVSEKLIRTKKELNDTSLMDQNVFNLVFDGHIRLLPIRFNFMPVSLERSYSKWNISQINDLYGTDYKNKKELFCDAVIIHYSSKDKPWKAMDGAMAAEWISVYLETPIKHSLTTLNNKRDEVYGISVIMPCYNVENYIAQTLDSILSQTFQDFEVICLDDGSTDGTLSILKKYEREHENLRVVADSNHRQGYQRNQGIRMAKGKYLYYMDSDDLLNPECFETIFRYAEQNRLDLLYFEGESFYESIEMEKSHPNYKTLYGRRDAFPNVYSGHELYIKFRKTGGYIVSPCLQLINRKFLMDHHLYFPELPVLEDNLYTFWAVLKANRVKCLGVTLFYRRVRENSTMTIGNSIEKLRERIFSYTIIIQEITKKLMKYNMGSPMYMAISGHLRGIYSLLNNCMNDLIKIEEKAELGKTILSSEEIGYGYAAVYIDAMETKIRRLSKELNESKRKSQQKDKIIKSLKASKKS